jgi:hypothetical protein
MLSRLVSTTSKTAESKPCSLSTHFLTGQQWVKPENDGVWISSGRGHRAVIIVSQDEAEPDNPGTAILKIRGKTLAHVATRFALSLSVGLVISMSESVQAANDGGERVHPCENWVFGEVPPATVETTGDIGAATEFLRIGDGDIARGNYSGAAKAYMESSLDVPSTHADLGAALAFANERYYDQTLDKVLIFRAEQYRRALATYCRVRGDESEKSALRRFPFAAMLEHQVWDIDAYLRAAGTAGGDAPALSQVMIEGRTRIRMAPRLDAAIVHQLDSPMSARVKPLSRNAEWVAVYHGESFAGYIHASLITTTK